MRKNVKIHGTAIVGEKASIGQGTSIWQYCVIQDDVVIGEYCSFGANVFVENGVKLGNGVKVKNNISLYTGVICEDNVFLGPNCVFTNVINPRSFISRKNEFQDTLIKKGASIGANSTILCGKIIGKYAMVGAGSVVTKDIPDYALVMGNPARIKGYVCKCGCNLDTSLKCTGCSKEYEKKEGVIMSKKRDK
ncbi:MAG: N-acetyltransferase [Lachnospiraceae bacterium]|nr:N-acetyltransferase [Lachnospiraceae bacterium]